MMIAPVIRQAKIHVRSVWTDHGREEAENEHDDTISYTKGIKKNTPDTWDVERTPDQFVRVPSGTGHLTLVANRSTDAVPEKKGLGEHVGGIEAADADRDNVVESSCGTDIDQADSAGNASHDYDCVHGNIRACLEL